MVYGWYQWYCVVNFINVGGSTPTRPHICIYVCIMIIQKRTFQTSRGNKNKIDKMKLNSLGREGLTGVRTPRCDHEHRTDGQTNVTYLYKWFSKIPSQSSAILSYAQLKCCLINGSFLNLSRVEPRSKYWNFPSLVLERKFPQAALPHFVSLSRLKMYLQQCAHRGSDKGRSSSNLMPRNLSKAPQDIDSSFFNETSL